MIAVARTADLVIIMLDASKGETQKYATILHIPIYIISMRHRLTRSLYPSQKGASQLS